MNAVGNALVEWLRRNIAVFIGGIAGAIGGFIYYSEIGCISGSCPITSNPYISTVYGAVLGALLVASFKPRRKSKPDDHTHDNNKTTT